MKKLKVYASHLAYNSLPSFYFKRKYCRLQALKSTFNQKEIEHRLNYYIQPQNKLSLPENESTPLNHFKFHKPSFYYFDLKEYTHYFLPTARIAYKFGDDVEIYPYPVLIKARPINEQNQTSVLFKLNKRRHFKFIVDTIPFEKKKNELVWRGDAHQPIRQLLLTKYQDKNRFNVGASKLRPSTQQWKREFLSIEQQLQYKFIFCPEGRDVATSLKWILSSNSLCIMPKPKFESWFMENELVAGQHYVEVKRDLSDLEEKMDYYNSQPKLSKEIIEQAHLHVERFKHPILEDILAIQVLHRYFIQTNQGNQIRF